MNINSLKEVVFSLIIVFLSTSVLNANAKRSEYHERVYNLNTIIQVKMNSVVEEQIDLIIHKKNIDSRYILGRTSLYFPKIENILREKGLPEELKFIAVIESSLQPEAVSRQGATGLWQFMKNTAILYGMEISKYVDERKDVIISTEKAADYLSALYQIYGNWTVALAAYNCGPGNVNKAIKKAGGVIDYWKIVPFLPRETREYIPRFIAASYLMNYYYLHGLEPIEPEQELKFTGAVRVFEKINFKDLETDLGVDLELLKKLNPIYVKGIVPKTSSGKYILTLPESALLVYLEKTKRFDDLVYMYSGTSNETTTHSQSLVSNKTSLKDDGIFFLQNKLTHVFSDNHSLQKVFIPEHPIKGKKTMYILKKKESLASVAEKNNISLEKLLSINGLSDHEEPTIKTQLVLFP